MTTEYDTLKDDPVLDEYLYLKHLKRVLLITPLELTSSIQNGFIIALLQELLGVGILQTVQDTDTVTYIIRKRATRKAG